MRDWIFRPNRGKRLVDWWAVDAWIDSSLYGVASKTRDLWSGYSNFISQFRVTGFRWLATEVFRKRPRSASADCWLC